LGKELGEKELGAPFKGGFGLKGFGENFPQEKGGFGFGGHFRKGNPGRFYFGGKGSGFSIGKPALTYLIHSSLSSLYFNWGGFQKKEFLIPGTYSRSFINSRGASRENSQFSFLRKPLIF